MEDAIPDFGIFEVKEQIPVQLELKQDCLIPSRKLGIWSSGVLKARAASNYLRDLYCLSVASAIK